MKWVPRVVAATLFVLALLAFSMTVSTRAKADNDLIECPYPATGVYVHVGVIGNAEGFACEYPTEINGSHRHCEAGGFLLGGGGGFAAGPMAGTLGISLGGEGWSCSYRCPGGELAAMPNPPGAWRERITPQPCVPLAPPEGP